MLVCTEGQQTHSIAETFQYRSMEAYGLGTGRRVGIKAVALVDEGFSSTRSSFDEVALISPKYA